MGRARRPLPRPLAPLVLVAFIASGAASCASPSSSSSTSLDTTTSSSTGDATAAEIPADVGPRADEPPAAPEVNVGSKPPACERLHAAPLAPGAPGALLGSKAGALWAADVGADGQPSVRWVRRARGVVQAVAAGDAGDGFALWVAWGQSRSDREAPIRLERLDPATGEGREVWTTTSPRREIVSLAVADVDGDGKRDLATMYFAADKGVRTRDVLATGTVREGGPIHMASTRAFVDLDGDGKPDEIVGQVYDEDPTRVGKLRAHVAGAWHDVPTSGGIRTAFALEGRGGERSALVVSDGWNKNYGKEAKARLSLARWKDQAFSVEPIGTSSRDVSFFDVSIAASSSATVILARGDATTTAFTRTATGWAERVVPELARAKSVALVERGADGVFAYDARRPGDAVRIDTP